MTDSTKALGAILGMIEQTADAPLGRLVRGTPLEVAVVALKKATVESLLGNTPRKDAAQAVLAGLWVAADGFEEAHELAQGLPDEWGAWWHAILHRREPDASNALYWYRKVRAPTAVWNDLGKRAIALLGSEPPSGLEPLAKALTRSGHWEPEPFVRACERGQKGELSAAAIAKLIELQRLEWRTWVEHCRTSALSN